MFFLPVVWLVRFKYLLCQKHTENIRAFTCETSQPLFQRVLLRPRRNPLEYSTGSDASIACSFFSYNHIGLVFVSSSQDTPNPKSSHNIITTMGTEAMRSLRCAPMLSLNPQVPNRFSLLHSLHILWLPTRHGRIDPNIDSINTTFVTSIELTLAWWDWYFKFLSVLYIAPTSWRTGHACANAALLTSSMHTLLLLLPCSAVTWCKYFLFA